jgi:hypothetical protein
MSETERSETVLYTVLEYFIRMSKMRYESNAEMRDIYAADIEFWTTCQYNNLLVAYTVFCDRRRRYVTASMRAGWKSGHTELVEDMLWYRFGARRVETVNQIVREWPFWIASQHLDPEQAVMILEVSGRTYRVTRVHDCLTITRMTGPSVECVRAEE